MKSVVLDPEKCVGCKHCYLACAQVHSQSDDIFGAINETPVPRARIFVDIVHDQKPFANRCRHCEPSPCLSACPSGAIFREEKTESVLIDQEKCINCAMCAMACPFGVIRFYPEADMPFQRVVAVKCDNCVDRILENQLPACVEACKTGALVYGEINDLLREKHLVAIRQEKLPVEIETWRSMNAAMAER
ncbi:carbon-monoxide dehydrogenase iron sulfur subunit [Desulfocicer vacuolatum DSM 3385]|uniref:Carbon-monoxide dehydrogenase iron sulfur subunit n=1 Tax=Desulfocicer vacuolatum DSM 3385 TaxID=1121400 RepID=A0A1W2AR69_9BACT|nr:4Fe-4S dicluster domain-containing protein [Desulfocicer vacuolatum]SMC63207.1 carbon-monoxide dehydrogenase iron sulfur subunit [Desulfocicer vacuolatum DSM 3385]